MRYACTCLGIGRIAAFAVDDLGFACIVVIVIPFLIRMVLELMGVVKK